MIKRALTFKCCCLFNLKLNKIITESSLKIDISILYIGDNNMSLYIVVVVGKMILLLIF
jgi:hypothetical protein